MGFSDAGLPLSLQLAAPAFGELSALRVADTFQQRTDWHLRMPSIVEPTAVTAA
jgi:aspartyl-tRNA(Asn)/glutamyl-tRNA(Gln) amidotransferase subunit A